MEWTAFVATRQDFRRYERGLRTGREAHYGLRIEHHSGVLRLHSRCAAPLFQYSVTPDPE